MIKIQPRLKEHRKSLNLNQSHVAKILEIKTHKYVQYEKGEKDPPIKVLAILADLYNIGIDELYNITIDPSFKKLYQRMEEEKQTRPQDTRRA